MKRVAILNVILDNGNNTLLLLLSLPVNSTQSTAMRDVVLGIGKYWDAMYELSSSIAATHNIRLAHIKYKQSIGNPYNTL